MDISVTKNQEGAKLTLSVEGKINTNSAAVLKGELGDLSGITELILDLEKTAYIASAGFRVFIEAYRKMADNKGHLKIINVSAENMEIFRFTGLADVLDVTGA